MILKFRKEKNFKNSPFTKAADISSYFVGEGRNALHTQAMVSPFFAPGQSGNRVKNDFFFTGIFYFNQ